MFQTVADISGGSVYTINAQTPIDSIFSVLSVQQSGKRLNLYKGRLPTGQHNARIPVDPDLTDMLVVLQGCNMMASIRDNRGKSKQIPN